MDGLRDSLSEAEKVAKTPSNAGRNEANYQREIEALQVCTL